MCHLCEFTIAFTKYALLSYLYMDLIRTNFKVSQEQQEQVQEQKLTYS